jgi:hypothetical protein
MEGEFTRHIFTFNDRCAAPADGGFTRVNAIQNRREMKSRVNR